MYMYLDYSSLFLVIVIGWIEGPQVSKYLRSLGLCVTRTHLQAVCVCTMHVLPYAFESMCMYIMYTCGNRRKLCCTWVAIYVHVHVWEQVYDCMGTGVWLYGYGNLVSLHSLFSGLSLRSSEAHSAFESLEMDYVILHNKPQTILVEHTNLRFNYCL